MAEEETTDTGGLEPLESFSDYLKRTTIQKVRDAAQKHGVDPDFAVRVADRESVHFNPDVITGKRNSPKGAQGVMQLMPNTAKSLGVDPDNYDIDSNIEGGVKHLAYLGKKYKDQDRVAAAYNAGEGAFDSGKADKFKETSAYRKAVALPGAQALKSQDQDQTPRTLPTGKPAVPTDEEISQVSATRAAITKQKKLPPLESFDDYVKKRQGQEAAQAKLAPTEEESPFAIKDTPPITEGEGFKRASGLTNTPRNRNFSDEIYENVPTLAYASGKAADIAGRLVRTAGTASKIMETTIPPGMPKPPKGLGRVLSNAGEGMVESGHTVEQNAAEADPTIGGGIKRFATGAGLEVLPYLGGGAVLKGMGLAAGPAASLAARLGYGALSMGATSAAMGDWENQPLQAGIETATGAAIPVAGEVGGAIGKSVVGRQIASRLAKGEFVPEALGKLIYPYVGKSLGEGLTMATGHAAGQAAAGQKPDAMGIAQAGATPFLMSLMHLKGGFNALKDAATEDAIVKSDYDFHHQAPGSGKTGQFREGEPEISPVAGHTGNTDNPVPVPKAAPQAVGVKEQIVHDTSKTVENLPEEDLSQHSTETLMTDLLRVRDNITKAKAAGLSAKALGRITAEEGRLITELKGRDATGQGPRPTAEMEPAVQSGEEAVKQVGRDAVVNTQPVTQPVSAPATPVQEQEPAKAPPTPGQFYHNLFTGSAIESGEARGAHAFFNDPHVKDALGLDPGASSGDVRSALQAQFAPEGTDPKKFSLSENVPPERLMAWAKNQGLHQVEAAEGHRFTPWEKLQTATSVFMPRGKKTGPAPGPTIAQTPVEAAPETPVPVETAPAETPVKLLSEQYKENEEAVAAERKPLTAEELMAQERENAAERNVRVTEEAPEGTPERGPTATTSEEATALSDRDLFTRMADNMSEGDQATAEALSAEVKNRTDASGETMGEWMTRVGNEINPPKEVNKGGRPKTKGEPPNDFKLPQGRTPKNYIESLSDDDLTRYEAKIGWQAEQNPKLKDRAQAVQNSIAAERVRREENASAIARHQERIAPTEDVSAEDTSTEATKAQDAEDQGDRGVSQAEAGQGEPVQDRTEAGVQPETPVNENKGNQEAGIKKRTVADMSDDEVDARVSDLEDALGNMDPDRSVPARQKMEASYREALGEQATRKAKAAEPEAETPAARPTSDRLTALLKMRENLQKEAGDNPNDVQRAQLDFADKKIRELQDQGFESAPEKPVKEETSQFDERTEEAPKGFQIEDLPDNEVQDRYYQAETPEAKAEAVKEVKRRAKENGTTPKEFVEAEHPIKSDEPVDEESLTPVQRLKLRKARIDRGVPPQVGQDWTLEDEARWEQEKADKKALTGKISIKPGRDPVLYTGSEEHKALADTRYVERGSLGSFVPADRVGLIAERLRSFGYQGIAETLEKAAAQGKSGGVVLANIGAVQEQGLSPFSLRGIIRHEMMHATIRGAGIDPYSRETYDWYKSHPLSEKISAQLNRAKWYRERPQSHAEEAATTIASGLGGTTQRPSNLLALGLTHAEQVQYLSDFFDHLVDAHGPEVLNRIGRVDPRLQADLDNAAQGARIKWENWAKTQFDAEDLLREHKDQKQLGPAGPGSIRVPEVRQEGAESPPQAPAEKPGDTEPRYGGFGAILEKAPTARQIAKGIVEFNKTARSLQTFGHLSPPMKQGFWYFATRPEQAGSAFANMVRGWTMAATEHDAIFKNMSDSGAALLGRIAGLYHGGEADLRGQIGTLRNELIKGYGMDPKAVKLITGKSIKTESFRDLSDIRDDLKGMAEHLEKSGMKKQQVTESLTDYLKRTGAQEEMAASQWMDNVPGLKTLKGKSNRAYLGFLDTQRQDVWSRFVEMQYAKGHTWKTHQKEFTDMADNININTGRGSLGPLENHAATLGAIFYSPRYMASRVQMFDPRRYIDSAALRSRVAPTVMGRKLGISDTPTYSKVVRNSNLRDTARLAMNAVVIGGALKGLSMVSGINIGMSPDPEDSTFGRLKIGNRVMQVFGGGEDYVRTVARMYRAIHGDEGDDGYAQSDPEEKAKRDSKALGVALKFLRGKASPMVSLGVDKAKGTTMDYLDGRPEPATWGAEARKNLLLFPAQDMLKGVLESDKEGWSKIKDADVLSSLPSALGARTYKKDEEEDR